MKKIMLICALLLAGVKGFCNTDDHVIIAVDLRSNIARFECDYTINAIQRVVPQILNRNNLNEGYASMHFFSGRTTICL